MSIATHTVNSRPRLTEYLVRKKVFATSPLTIVDIGARGGAEKQWQIYRNQRRIIGFEADAQECIKLNKTSSNKERYYPVALGRKRGRVIFFIHPHAATSGFYKSDASFLKRFPGSKPFLPRATTLIETIDFATFAKRNKIDDIDFMKIDVEGAELDVLKGLGKKFENSVAGISAEAVFYPWRHGMPTFAELDSFLRKRHFVLYDLPIFRWEKASTSPYMFTDDVFGPTDKGQVVWAQALYLKDAVAELRIPSRRKHWSALKILKLTSIMELYQLEDCAIELIWEAATQGLLKKYDVKKMVDLLTPMIGGRIVTYSQYVAHIRRAGSPRYVDGRRVSQAAYEKFLKRRK